MTRQLMNAVSTRAGMEQSFSVNDTHKAGNIGNMAEGHGFPRVDSLVRILAFALRRTCRVEHLIEQTDNRSTSGSVRPATHLHVIITVFSLSNSIPPPSDLREISLKEKMMEGLTLHPPGLSHVDLSAAHVRGVHSVRGAAEPPH